ncbi:MAG: hypothetical protein ACRES3_02775 [Steroidobacteraceae bacterium]
MAMADGMTISFESRILPDHARLECTGTFSLETMLGIYEQAFALAAGAGRDAVLIDARNVTGREPTLGERYTQAVHVAELQSTQSPRIRLAILGHEPMIHRERFGEIVATERGAVVRVFTDESAALEWLLTPSRSPQSMSKRR